MITETDIDRVLDLIEGSGTGSEDAACGHEVWSGSIESSSVK